MFLGFSENPFPFEMPPVSIANRHIIPQIQVVGKRKQTMFQSHLAH
jgi:hypothetical protein